MCRGVSRGSSEQSRPRRLDACYVPIPLSHLFEVSRKSMIYWERLAPAVGIEAQMSNALIKLPKSRRFRSAL